MRLAPESLTLKIAPQSLSSSKETGHNSIDSRSIGKELDISQQIDIKHLRINNIRIGLKIKIDVWISRIDAEKHP